MDPLVAAVLGAVQGLTEFLPVSSSGHVAIGALLFGVQDMPLSMVVVVHAGTLAATLVVFRRDIADLGVETVRGIGRPRQLLATDRGRVVGGVVVASVPTAILGLLLEDSVESWARKPLAVGLFLLVTAAVLLSTRSAEEGQDNTLSWGAYGLIGLAQGLAVMPGISRSGATIAAAMWLGMRAPEAFRFSFLLSLPAVGGAVALELGEPGALAQLGTPALIAGAVAFITGWVALLALRRVVMSGKLWLFALYLAPVGLLLCAWGAL